MGLSLVLRRKDPTLNVSKNVNGYVAEKEMRMMNGTILNVEMEIYPYPDDDETEIYAYRMKITMRYNNETVAEIKLPRRVARDVNELVKPMKDIRRTTIETLQWYLSLIP